MVYKINPFHQLIWRTPDTLQLGVGGQRQIFSRVSQGQERLINALYFGVAEGQLPALAKQIQLPLAQAEQLLTKVAPLLLPRDFELEPEPFSVAQAEASRAALDNAKLAETVLAVRRRSAVHLDCLDATGLSLLLAFAAAGVGTITTKDHGKVTEQDASTNAYPRSLVGYQRFTAAKMILEASWPGTRLVSTNRANDKKTARVNLAVLINHQITPPSEVARWRTMEIPVLEIRYQPDGAEVSPVLTGESGCLVCRDHAGQDLDDAHLTLCAQLVTSELRFDDSGTRLVAAGIAEQLALEFLDEGSVTPQRKAFGYRYFRFPALKIEKTEWKAHPSCGCQLVAETSLAAAG
jgi:hypothetical protein